MKVKINKESDNKYVIITEKFSYTLEFSSSSTELTIKIKEISKQGLISTSLYQNSFSFLRLCKIDKIFTSFNNIKEIHEGIKIHLETELFGVKKDNKKIILSLYLLGKIINLELPDRKKELNVEEKFSDLTELFEDYMKKINQFLQEIFVETKTEHQDKMIKFFLDSLQNNIQIMKNFKFQNLPVKESTKDKNLIKIIKQAHKFICCLCTLKDGRFACCLNDKTIQVFNIKDYQCQIKITESVQVNFISVFENGNLVSCSEDKTIKFWEVSENSLQLLAAIQTEHTDTIEKVIELSNNRISSCSLDKTIKIFYKFSSYECIRTLVGHRKSVYSIIELRNQKYIVSAGFDNTLRFWNNSTYECEKVIENIPCVGNTNLIQVDDYRLAIGNTRLEIFSLRNFKVENSVVIEKLGSVGAILKIEEGIILCGWGKGLVRIDVAKSQILNIQIDAHDQKISCISQSNGHLLASSSIDGLIKIWDNNVGMK